MACSGIAIAILGFLIYFFRKSADGYLAFILAVPPIGVAAYVFVFNLFGKSSEKTTEIINLPMKEILSGSAFAGFVFFIFSLGLFISVSLLKKYF